MTTKSVSQLTLLTFDPITTAVTASTSATVSSPRGRVESLSLYSIFSYGSGGTTLKAWVQTSFDGGATWMDIANFAATTAAKSRLYNLIDSAVTTIATPTDGTLADDTSVGGFLGPIYRVKYTTTGTYAGASSLYIYGIFK